MERETAVRGAMVVTILGLLTLILVTPNLLGRPPELASLPLLLIGLTRDGTEFVVDVGGAVGAYMYSNVTLEAAANDNPSYVSRISENDTYGVHIRVPVASTVNFTVHAYLVDRQENYFEYNLTASLRTELGRTVMVFRLAPPDERDAREERRTPPDDFRWAVPLRGSL